MTDEHDPYSLKTLWTRYKILILKTPYAQTTVVKNLSKQFEQDKFTKDIGDIDKLNMKYCIKGAK